MKKCIYLNCGFLIKCNRWTSLFLLKVFHVLISSFQLVPAALDIAMEEDVEFRQGLPLDYLTYMGVQNSDKVIFFFFLTLCAILLLHSNNSSSCVGWPTQDKILLTNWKPDEEANKLCPGRCCCGSESQGLPPWLPASYADSRYVLNTSVCNHPIFSSLDFKVQPESENSKAQTCKCIQIPQDVLWLGDASCVVLLTHIFIPSSTEELASSVQGAPARWESGQIMDVGAHINPETRVRLLRAGCAR